MCTFAVTSSIYLVAYPDATLYANSSQKFKTMDSSFIIVITPSMGASPGKWSSAMRVDKPPGI